MTRLGSACRLVALAASASTSLLLLATAAPLSAAAPNGYAAIPERAPAEARFIVRERMWRCDTQGICRGPVSTGNRHTACALAARQLGKLNAFTVDGVAFDAAALERCNGRA